MCSVNGYGCCGLDEADVLIVPCSCSECLDETVYDSTDSAPSSGLEFEGAVVYEATNSPGQPICIAGRTADGLSVNAYRSDEGAILGVTVYDYDGYLVAAKGVIPFDVVQEEREAQGLPPLELDIWLEAEGLLSDDDEPVGFWVKDYVTE